jgi:hypothetical protein
MASFSTKTYQYINDQNELDSVDLSVQIDDCDNNCSTGTTYTCNRRINISPSSGVTGPVYVDFREFWQVDTLGDGSSVISGETFFQLAYTGTTLPADFYVTCYEFNDPQEITREHFYLDQQSIPTPASEISILNIDITNESASGATDGALSISAVTNNPPIEYSIDSGSTYFSTSGFTNLSGGTYHVFVRNASGDTDNETVVIQTLSGSTSGETGTTTTNNIILESQPYLISASENPILVELSSKINSLSPQYAKTEIEIVNTVSQNDYIQFLIDNLDIKLIAKDNPGFQEFFTSSGNTLGDVANSLRFAVNDHPVLNRLYYANSSGATVTVTAKKLGSKFELVPGSTLIDNSTGISSTLTVSGSSKFYSETKSDYGYYINLYLENALGDLEFIKTIEQPAVYPVNKFNLSGILKNYVSSTLPNYSPTAYTQSVNHIRKFNYDLGELYAKSKGGYKFQYPFETSGQTKWVMNASLDYYVENTLSSFNKLHFLTLSPDNKPVHSAQKDYLYFLSTDALSNVSLEYRFSYFDGTQSLWQTGFTANITPGVHYIDVSPSTFNISSQQKTVWKIEVKLTDALSNFNQVQTFELQVEESDTGYDILFQNSLGCFESFRFTGEVTDSIIRNTQSYQKSYYGKLSQSDSINTTKNVEIKNVYSLNSGLINTDTFIWLKDLTKSTQVYLNKNDAWVSVTPDKLQYEKSTDDDFYSISLEVTESIPANTVRA